MKIETNVEIGEQSKAAMIANKVPIPKLFLTFEMSAEKAHIFASAYASYRKLIVSEQTIYAEDFRIVAPETKKVQYGIDHKDGYISSWKQEVGKTIHLANVLRPDIISGVLTEGMNIDIYLEKIEAQITENQKLFDKAQAELAEFEAHAPQREQAKQAYEAEQARANAEREAKEKAEREAKEAEKAKINAEKEAKRLARLEWAKEYGSEHLQKGLEQGYDCIKQYDIELGEYLIKDSAYEYDRENLVDTKDRSCPSLDALCEAERINEIEGLAATIVWLPDGLYELHKDPDEYSEPENGCEAVSVDVKGTSGYWYKTF